MTAVGPRVALAAIQARADAVDPEPSWQWAAALADDARSLVAALGAVLDLADAHDTATTPAEWLADDIRAVIAEHLGGET